MNRKIAMLLFALLLACTLAGAQTTEESSLQQRAETEDAKGNIANARSLFIRAFDDYASRGEMQPGVACGTRAVALYYKENYFKEAFDLLRRIDQSIEASDAGPAAKAALHYQTTRERFQMYMKLRRSANVTEQLAIMESQVHAAGDEALASDLLYNKTIFYYTFGQTEKAGATFRELASRLTTDKDYDKVDEVYQTLIANGRRAGNANIVAQSYSSYIVWKDSVNALRVAAQTDALQQQIDALQTTIAEKDDSLASRRWVIVGLGVLAAALAVVLVVGAVVLLRYMVLTRRQKKAIRMANESGALKAKFISNISAQLEPTLRRLDSRQPEVQALLDFSEHIQTLSALENATDGTPEKEDTQIAPFCEQLMDTIRQQVKRDVVLTVNAPKLSIRMNREYTRHILAHLLANAAIYTPEGGHIVLEYKKRGAHKHQFLVSDTGSTIPEEKREDVFKPFLEVRDLTTGDGLGLPICRQMALKMNGDLSIDPDFSKGTRFVLDLYE